MQRSDSTDFTFKLHDPSRKVSVGLCEGGVKPPHSKAGFARKCAHSGKQGRKILLLIFRVPENTVRPAHSLGQVPMELFG